MVIPPVLAAWLKFLFPEHADDNSFSGNYTDWDEALLHCTGYNRQMILEKVKDAGLRVKTGEAAYERDGVLFSKIDFSWPLLSGLLRIASMNGNQLRVLDFGGSLGTSYYQNKSFLSSLDLLEWSIVEQSNFVKCGKEFFEDDSLKFYFSIGEFMENRKPDVVLLSSVLQYLPDPDLVIRQIIETGTRHIILDKTLTRQVPGNPIKIQHVPGSIYEASYPVRFFNEDFLLSGFLPHFRLVADFGYPQEYNSAVLSHQSEYKGYIFERKN